MKKPPTRPLRVAAIQHAAGSDRCANLAAIEGLLPPPGTVDLVVLPELFACRGALTSLAASAEPIGGDLTRWLIDAAMSLNCWMLGGSIVERKGSHLYNTSLLVDNHGQLRATYRKINLFTIQLSDGRMVQENSLYTPGRQPCLTTIEGWSCGLSICFDLRFPELYRHYTAQGAQVLMIPADFTDETGRAHWQTLICARAIENQCYVIAPNQCGRNPQTGVKSYGHSLIVDPWGDILSQAGDASEVMTATLDPVRCAAIRTKLPLKL